MNTPNIFLTNKNKSILSIYIVVDRKCAELGLDWAGEISGRLDDSDWIRGAGEFGSLAEGGSLVRLVHPD